MQVVAINPKADIRPDEQVIPKKGFLSRHEKVIKSLSALGVLAIVAVGCYYAGTMSGSSPSEPNSINDEASTTLTVSMAQDIISNAYKNESNVAFSSNLTITDIDAFLDIYESNKSSWFDNFLTAEIMEAFSVIRNAYIAQKVPITLRNLRQERQLDAFLDTVYEKVENAQWGNAVQSGDDYILVESDGTYCWIIAQPSNSANDWFSNLDLGSEDIMSIQKYTATSSSCGCKKTTLWWCSEYYSCPTYIKIGSGYDGFVKPYNNMRLEVFSQINSKCQTSQTKILAGYSRGGAIVSALAYALTYEGLISTSKIQMYTFGSPRVLGSTESDFIHGKFTQMRIIYKKDPIPSLPYTWMGYKHFGEMSCYSCGYAASRDAPGWSWLTDAGDHTKYCTYYGNQVCV